jgi:hypothetical protein
MASNLKYSHGTDDGFEELSVTVMDDWQKRVTFSGTATEVTTAQCYIEHKLSVVTPL